MSNELKTATLSYVVDTDPGATASQDIYSPITGLIKKITLTFPRNSNYTLGAKFTVGTETIIPTPARGGSEYIRLDNHTETIYPYFPIKKGTIITLRTINDIVGDADQDTVSAIVHIEKQ